MTVPGILRALEEASLFRDALTWAQTDADLGLVDGLDAPALAGLLEKRRAAGHPPALLTVVPTGHAHAAAGEAIAPLVTALDRVAREIPAAEADAVARYLRRVVEAYTAYAGGTADGGPATR